MNLSLRKRIGFAFVAAILVLLIQGGMVFFFLDNLSKDVQAFGAKFNQESTLIDEIRSSINQVFKEQRALIMNPKMAQEQGEASLLLERLLKKADQVYKTSEMKKAISSLEILNKQYRDFLQKIKQQKIRVDILSIETISDNMEEIYEEFSTQQFLHARQREQQIEFLVADTKRQMLITLIITFLGAILLSLIIPGKIAMPFRKIKAAIRELRDCNFDVSIHYEQEDEIGEVAKELNKLIASLKEFEALRVDRIEVEMKKFETLANLVKKNVLVTDSDGRLIYLNHNLYSLLDLSSDDIIGKEIQETTIPESIREAYLVALKRRTKVENAEVLIEKRDDNGNLVEHFQGFANVIPIRGRESSQDYYLMVLSKEVFA